MRSPRGASSFYRFHLVEELIMSRRIAGVSFLAVALAAGLALAADSAPGLGEVGKPDLKSAGPLAFGPKGVLFVGDP